MRNLTATAILLGATILGFAAGAPSAAAQSPPDDAFWQRDPASPGDWFDDANWNPAAPGPLSSATIDNLGTAVIGAGHAEALGAWIGFNNSGALRIAGGSAAFQWNMSLGYQHDAFGQLELSGGDLTVGGSLGVGRSAGRGEVAQSAGNVNVGVLQLGDAGVDPSSQTLPSEPEDRGRGSYHISGGAVHALHGITVGLAGVGEFQQTGGSVRTGRMLRVGGQLDSLILEVDPTRPPIELDLNESQFATAANAAAASPLQIIHHALVIDLNYQFVPSRGSYALSAGQLAAETLVVDRTGSYRQTGGSGDFDFVAIQDQADFELRGGELHAELGFHSAIPVNLDGGATLSVGAGILNLSAGIVEAQDAHIVAGAGSLTILPAGFNANTGFGTFNRQGLVHVAGRDLKLAAGKRFGGAGVINDFVDAAGQIAAAPGQGITLNRGLRVRAGAEVDLGTGGVAVSGRPATIQGGSLTASTLAVVAKLSQPWYAAPHPYSYSPLGNVVAADAPGVVRQTAGKANITTNLAIVSGAYHMHGGELDANSIDVGLSQLSFGGQGDLTARFVQTGGTVRAGQVTLSPTYVFLYAQPPIWRQSSLAFETDNASTGDQSVVPLPPRIPMEPLGWPDAAELHASYRLTGGDLLVDALSLSQSNAGGSSRFIQTGGNIVAAGGVSLYGPDSLLAMHGGSLTTRRFSMGAEYVFPDFTPLESATFAIRNAASDIEIRGELIFGGGSRFQAVPGSTIRLSTPDPEAVDWRRLEASRFNNLSLDDDDLAGLNNLTMIFDGMTDEASTFEVAALDLGDVAAGFRRNFALDALHVGGDAPALLQLVDLVDNQRDGHGNEALYVDTLVITAGSILDLGGLNLYYRRAIIEGEVLPTAGGALFAVVPEPATVMLMLAASLGWIGLRPATAATPRRPMVA